MNRTDVAFMDLIENTTTVPIEPNDALPFWELVLGQEQPTQPRKHSTGDPLWAVILVLLGALFLIGSGSFIITLWWAAQ